MRFNKYCCCQLSKLRCTIELNNSEQDEMFMSVPYFVRKQYYYT